MAGQTLALRPFLRSALAFLKAGAQYSRLFLPMPVQEVLFLMLRFLYLLQQDNLSLLITVPVLLYQDEILFQYNPL